MTAVNTPRSLSSPSPDLILSYTDAADTVQKHAHMCRRWTRLLELVPLDNCAGRVLGQEISADRNQPPFPRSTRDGFAGQAADFRRTPQGGEALKILALLRAGEAWQGDEIQPGEAVEIMTGAPVPPGADCVVMIEHVAVENGLVRLTAPREIAPGENIIPAGAEALAGSVIVSASTRMGPGQIAAAAACGYTNVHVCAKPRVAILATGDELVEVAEQPQPHQIRNSNSYSLAAQVAACGALPVIQPIVRDDAAGTVQAIRNAADCDLILLTGGVSMGKYDFVEQALLTLEAEFFFTGAKIQPGRPVVFGRLPGASGGRYFFGLPGNPLSAMVTFALFAAPLLEAMSGDRRHEPHFIRGQLTDQVPLRVGLTRFLPARSESWINGTEIQPLRWQGSGDLASAARANCFLVVPEASGADHPEYLVAGEMASALLI
jgi:molybdopterin molybdotransferase